MINPQQLSDAELATCVDEYCNRIIAKARARGLKETITVNVLAMVFGYKDEYTIGHNISIGSYPNESKHKSSNALHGIEVLLKRHYEDAEVLPEPQRLMLPAQAEVVEDVGSTLDDNYPF